MSAALEADEGLEVLLEHVRDVRGFDFTGYKRASLGRRIRKRMLDVGVDTFADYLSVLEASPAELTELFDTILINVTAFRRDRPAWDHLASVVIPRILDGRDPDEPLRVWSAGCSSGEEAYSLAVLLCDAVGVERFRRSVKIYGSDVDEDAIAQARQARSTHAALTDGFTAEQIEQYFQPGDGGYVFRSDLRRSVIFGRHDLVQDPPISRIDLLVCRNTLMYFNAEVQRRVLRSFHFALDDGGFLFLGQSESLVTRTDLFVVDDLAHHVFRKRVGVDRSGPLLTPLRTAVADDGPVASLLRSGFESSPLPQLLVDGAGRLLHASRRARQQFGLSQRQMGRPLRDLEVSYRPIDLRSRLDEAAASSQPVVVPDVRWEGPDGSVEIYEVVFSALGNGDGGGGTSITFTPTGRVQSLREELLSARREVEAAHEEIRSAVEELETTNEELQSTNEELETTNEELHSTNEELETMNEELQSTNEELESINGELRHATAGLDRATSFLGAVLGSIGSAVVVLDDQLAVRAWNGDAEELWGVRAEEAQGQHVMNLDIGLPVEGLRDPIRAALADGRRHEEELEAVNRRGRSVRCCVRIAPLVEADSVTGVILRMDVAAAP
ncbi:MAG TPA: CheR family methyltransferase [Iamia sp.]|nr:CheR family methyltransferase [Iamia sp.]